jgi:ribosomal protein S18 acetylase RimI-like enzyme
MLMTQLEASITVRAAATEDRNIIEDFSVALQDFERRFRPSRRPGSEVAREYVDTLFQRVTSQDGAIFLAETRRGPVGFLACHIGRDALERISAELVVSDVWVAAETRRRGVFKALISAAQAHARDLRASRLTVSTLIENAGACAAYESLGFRRSFMTFEFRAEDEI